MKTPVSVTDKKEFLQWFIKENKVIKWQNLRILNYITNDLVVLEHIRFVRDVSSYSRSLTVSGQRSQELSFQYNKHEFITTDTEKIFHDIRFNKTKTLYIKFDFDNHNQSSHYAFVLEENIYDDYLYETTKETNDYIEQLFRNSYYYYENTRLKKEINKALDSRDYSLFIKLSNALNRLGSNNEGPELHKNYIKG